jgi:hypothetical protein
MKVNTYRILDNAVDAGIEYGYQRAHKHTDEPSAAQIKRDIHDAIMNELSEVFIFDDNSDDITYLHESKTVL